MPSDVITAIQNQNVEVAAGEIGGMPQPQGQMLDATVTAQSRLQTPEQFRNIIVKSDPSGARVLLSDVARVELGAENYSATIRINGHPGAGIGIFLEPGANALTTSKLVKATMDQVANRMPPGYAIAYANDSSDFIKLSVIEVVKTLPKRWCSSSSSCSSSSRAGGPRSSRESQFRSCCSARSECSTSSASPSTR